MDENILQNQQNRYLFSRSVGIDWKDLGRCLQILDSYLDVIDIESKNCCDKAYQMLTKWTEKENPSLNELKNALQTMEKNDLMKTLEDLQIRSSKEIEKSNLVKTDFLSDALKNFYLETYKTIEEIQPQLNKPYQVNFLDKFVDLYVVDEVEVQKDAINIAELDQFLKKQMSYTSILFEKHLKDLSLFLISGIAAIGKTWLLRKFLLDWSNGFIWKNIDLVFYLECKQLNLYENISNINELLDVFYKDILKGYNISLDFMQSKPSIMFIIDGLNEFKYFDQLISNTHCSSQEIPILNVFTEIYKYKAVISGRVNTISQYENVVTRYKDKLTIRVMGYNENGIKYYLRNNLIKKTKRRVKTMLKESSIAKTMAKVPFFLSCMCTIVADLKVKYNFINLTMTDLYAYNFLYFFQRHIFNENHEPIFKIMENNLNKQCILNICKMAYIFFIENKTTFSDIEIQTFISGFDQIESGLLEKVFLMKSGFIEKIETNFGYHYRFCQTAMIELCVSVHAYYSYSGKKIMENQKLKDCFSIIYGLLNTNENSFIKYLANLTNSNTEKISLNHVIDVIPKEINCDREYQDKQKLFMQCFFESQATITDDIKASIDERKWKILINGTKTSYEVLCEKYFVNHLVNSGGKLTSLEIDKNLLTDKEKDLIKQCSRNVKDIRIKRSYRFFIDQFTKRWIRSE
ncbi:NLR type 1 [Hydra vulgaris]|uniref:NLR type 1 n=1 Tax=Hydra vulgaris TaxID=6087 RepID=F2XX00_HYDVU|nr:NLR type 1 [Hydra vulgaris]ADU79234.1 NLR type 1 [Hydra vulgaris]